MNQKTKITIIVKSPAWEKLLVPYTKTVRAACEAALSNSSPRRRQARRGKSFARSNQNGPPPNLLPMGGGAELTVVLADDAFIQELNYTYRGKNKPTNVLSFPSYPESRSLNSDSSLGDIILALGTIQKEAKAQQKTLKDHAMHLIVHGVLHLLGYDHENEKEAASMEEKEIKILNKLGIKNPYL